MIGSWRVVLTYTIAFYTYQSTFLSKKLNVEEKLTGGPSPSVPGSKNQVLNRQKFKFIQLGFSNSIFQKSSADQQGG